MGGYRIVQKIGAGGFGIVYRAVSPTGQEVALKEYLPAALASRAHGDAPVVVERSNRALDEAIEIGRVSDVAAYGERAQPFGLPLQDVAAAREHRDVRPLRNQRLGNGQADARRCATDDCRPAGETELHCYFAFRTLTTSATAAEEIFIIFFSSLSWRFQSQILSWEKYYPSSSS